MNVVPIDFGQSANHVWLARTYSRLTGIELRRLMHPKERPLASAHRLFTSSTPSE